MITVGKVYLIYLIYCFLCNVFLPDIHWLIHLTSRICSNITFPVRPKLIIQCNIANDTQPCIHNSSYSHLCFYPSLQLEPSVIRQIILYYVAYWFIIFYFLFPSVEARICESRHCFVYLYNPGFQRSALPLKMLNYFLINGNCILFSLKFIFFKKEERKTFLSS